MIDRIRKAPMWAKLLGALVIVGVVVGAVVLVRSIAPPRAGTEEELVAFMLDFTMESEVRSMADYIETSGQPWVDAPPRASIIVYGPVVETEWGKTVDEKNPLRVWWVEGDEPSRIADTGMLEAMERYDATYVQPQLDGNATIFAWGEYHFGIVSIAPGGGTAEVLYEASCGPLCGHGVMYTLVRGLDGRWTITKEELMWLS